MVVVLVAAGLSSCKTPETSTASPSTSAEQPPQKYPAQEAEPPVRIQAPKTSSEPTNPTIDIGDPNLAVDFNLPPGALRGQRLKDVFESTVRQNIRQGGGPSEQEIRDIQQGWSDEFATVAATIDQVYQSLDKVKQAVFAPEYEATKRDLDRLREFALYNCIFPVSGEILSKATGDTNLKDSEYITSIIVGQNQIDMWHRGMMSWGVYYDTTKAGCWPTDMLTEAPNQISEGGQRIYKGDWRGAWLLNRGLVYVPGIAFYSATELKIRRLH
jgi:hypothetical protein